MKSFSKTLIIAFEQSNWTFQNNVYLHLKIFHRIIFKRSFTIYKYKTNTFICNHDYLIIHTYNHHKTWNRKYISTVKRLLMHKDILTKLKQNKNHSNSNVETNKRHSNIIYIHIPKRANAHFFFAKKIFLVLVFLKHIVF